MPGPDDGPTCAEAWQRHWHRILDREGVELASRPDPEAPLLSMDADFRLHFAFWTLEARGADVRREALLLLPRGGAIADRVERHLQTPIAAMPAREAEALLRQGLRDVRNIGLDAPAASDRVRLLDPDAVSYDDAFHHADTPFVAVRDALSDWAERESGPEGLAAFFFLSEPLYRLVSFYEVRDWAAWPLCAPDDRPDLTEAPYRLLQGGWIAGWDNEGAFLYRRSAGCRTDPG